MDKALGGNCPLIKAPSKVADKTHFNYVQPDEVILRYNGRGQKRHYPVLESIRAILREKSGAWWNVNPHLFYDDTLYDVIDWHIFSCFPQIQIPLKVMLVQYIFEIVQPFVSAQQTQNILALYLIL